MEKPEKALKFPSGAFFINIKYSMEKQLFPEQ